MQIKMQIYITLLRRFDGNAYITNLYIKAITYTEAIDS